MEKLVAVNGGEIVTRLKIGEKNVHVVELPETADGKSFKSRMYREGFVCKVDHPRYSYPTIEEFSDTRMLQGGKIPWGIANVFDSNLPSKDYLPDMVTHSICIVDSGYQMNHPDLPNATNADPNQGSSFSSDECEHGTHVAGTIAAIDNDEGVIGVYPGAPGMKIMKVFSGQNCRWSYASDLVRAVQQCASSGSKIVTMSLGGYRSSSLERDAFQKLFENEGILFVAAAGNGGNSRYSFPASYPFVMSVGAIDARNTVATFSQFNNQVDISGPGVRVQSTTGSDSYSFYSGTSMATPHVSGAALLLWNKHPSCSNKNIRSALEESAKDLGAPGRDDYYGHGAVRYNEADKILKGNLCGQRTPAPTPVPTPSCMSGETGLVAMKRSDRIGNKRSFRAISEGTSEHDTTQHIVKVKDLKLHDAIYGLDESKKPAVCRVEAVGNFGFGPVYGNYTDGHYTFNPDTGNVETHGQNGVLSVQDKYIVFTSCPLGVDEAGVKFTPFDTDFFGELMREMSWSNYLHLHSAILRIVRKSGDFWFHGSSYKNLTFLQEHAPILCSAILQCMKDNDDCHVVEDVSIAFIENNLVDHAKDKAYEAFQNIGQHRRLESISATITGGGSVRK